MSKRDDKDTQSLTGIYEVTYDYDYDDYGETVEQVVVEDKKYIDIEYFAKIKTKLEDQVATTSKLIAENSKRKARVQKLEEERREVSKEIEKYQQLSPDKTDWMAEYHVLMETIKELSHENIELEKQLAEKDETIKGLIEQYKYIEQSCSYQMFEDCQKQIEQLKQQLAESEKERELDNSFWKQECDSLQKALAEKDKEIEGLKIKLETANNERHEEWKTGKEWKWEWQKVNRQLEQANQDKISFAIERLEKVREELDKRPISIRNCGNGDFDEIILDDVYDVIDNQIKRLKEGK